VHTTTLGRTGEPLSAIGYGAMALSIEGRPSREEAERALHAAFDAGITFVDTADVYGLDDSETGHNERLIADVLRARADCHRIRVMTKGGMCRPGGAWTRDGSPAHLRRACERSLRALGVEQIDLYQLHAPDPHVPYERSVETLAELQREGKIRHVGLSNVAPAHIDAATRIVDVVAVQNRLSPYYRESLEEGVVAACEQRGITFLAYRPVGGAQMAGTLHDYPVLADLARRRGVSPQALSIAWVRAQSATVVPIPGGRKGKHVTDSAGAAAITLTSAEIAAIDEARWIAPVRFCAL
jgi:aryl-alcohol dehydrogenase-like predicted oxidoreductase